MPTGFYPSQPSDNTKILFMSSRGGPTLDRTFGQQVFIQGVTGNRQNYAAPQIHQTGPGELSVYSQSGARYTLRLDGFASVDTSSKSGELLTKPLTFLGDRLEINYTTGPAGSIRVEVQDATGQPIPGFALADSDPVSGDALAKTMTWKGSADVSGLAGRPIRLRFVMQDADLYSIRFQGGAGLQIPKVFVGQIGDTVSIPVQLTVAESGGLPLQSVDVAVSFDPTRLEVSGVRSGSLAPGLALQTQWDNASGTVTVRGTTTTVLIDENVRGDLFWVDFVIKNGAVLGETPVNLMAGLGAVTTQLNGGQTPLRPTPTNTSSDSIDGSVVVVGALFNLTSASSNTTTTTAAVDTTHPSVPPGTPQQVFQTERWDSPQGAELEWNFPVPAGDYLVRLYFAETFSGAGSIGARVFDVSIEGQVLLDNYDIFAEVGLGKGVVKSFLIASDTNLDIDFAHVTENPKINGIEIVRAHALQNYQSPNDVNADGVVSPIDALLVINELNRSGARGLDGSTDSAGNGMFNSAPSDGLAAGAAPAAQNFVGYIDTNGDDHLSLIDALRIINELNAVSSNNASTAQAALPIIAPAKPVVQTAVLPAEQVSTEMYPPATAPVPNGFSMDAPEDDSVPVTTAQQFVVSQQGVDVGGTNPDPAGFDTTDLRSAGGNADLDDLLAEIAPDVTEQWQVESSASRV
jgi:hypothetical protein